MPITKYLDPKFDITFKRIFGTEKNKGLLINFLNVVLKNQISSAIEDVIFLQTVQEPEIAARKQSIVDVLCEDSDGVKYIIEMQRARGSGFEQRAQYYAAKAYIAQMQAGDKLYENLKEVIFLAIADYDIFPDKAHYKSEHVILDKQSLENDLKMFSFTFVNLIKFAAQNKKIKDLSLEEKWYYFLKNAEGTSDLDLEELVGGDIVIREAYKELERFSWSAAELELYERELKRQLDENSIDRQKALDAKQRLIDAEQKGKARGEAKGKAEGRVEGIITVAKNMLAKGLDLQFIADATGLSVEEITKLK